ncbi:class I mannose-6-phosphate isomerase, partial [Candidatus Sumerlaeota bacterium]|nr:class I mannose-6-phosphate isomerase [Candidatus Sumerlaeota bacterium]
MEKSDFQKYPLLLAPHFAIRPWGGDRLGTVLNKAIPKGEKIGESWELSDHPDGLSRIANGPYAGWLFGDLFSLHCGAMCCLGVRPDRFPLLVKYIDAREDLSVQGHPNDGDARSRGDRGKTECWYILDCPQGAEVICGLREGVGPEELRRASLSGAIEPLLMRYRIHRGSFVRVPAGTVHSILAGTLLCEVQQASNLTYRLWDWGRLPARPLHIEDAVGLAAFRGGGTHEYGPA